MIDYIRPLPPNSNGLLGEEELSEALTRIFLHYSNTHTHTHMHRRGEEASVGVGLQAGEQRCVCVCVCVCVCGLTPAGSAATGLPAVDLPEGLSNLTPLK